MTCSEPMRLGPDDLGAVVALSVAHHRSLRLTQPWLPEFSPASLEGALTWLADQGTLWGLRGAGALHAFWGGFPVEDFRNAGPGVFCPDFAHGFAPGVDVFRATRTLYRSMGRFWVDQGYPLHAAAVYANEGPFQDALSLTGFGRIVADLARSRSDLETDLALGPPSGQVRVRRAVADDSTLLATWDAWLAGHIGASPVFMPRTQGRSAPEWERWLDQDDAVAWVAEVAGAPAGFLKAADPQWDVTRAVHGPGTLAISGLWVDPVARTKGVGRALLSSLVAEAGRRNKDLVSVDCETLNPEAWAFWSRWFHPVSWSWERRIGSFSVDPPLRADPSVH